ncbi:MAG: hypothetical protein IK102_11205 [Treponema sp.]|nr:hypothetical protein [Treponema sp.]
MIYLAKNKYFPFVIAVPLFLCVHSYRGIVLDAILYLLQYISTFDPSRFTNDLAFAFGNQDSYGFFSPILGVFVEAFGVDVGMRALCWLSHLGWAISAVFLVRAFCKFSYNKIWFIPFLILFILLTADGMPHTKVHFFRLVETYTCSRALSIIFGFAGLAALLERRKIASLILLLLGTIIHPLTAGWGLPLWFLFFYPRVCVPLLVFSALFPFLAFLHIGKFDFYPLDWLQRPLTFAPPKDLIVRNCVWFVFYGFLVPRFFLSGSLAKLGRAILFVSLIAFYWNLWGGFGEHIFLYQVQTWRAEWIPSVFSFLFCFVIIAQLFRKIRKRFFDSVDFSKFLSVVAVLSPISMLIPILFSAYYVRKKRFNIDVLKYMFFCLAFFLLIGFAVQQYVIWGLEGGYTFLGFDYQYLYRLQNSLLLNQALFAVICIALLVGQRKYFWTIPLVVFLIVPQYQLIPLSVIVWFLMESRKRFVVSVVVLLTLFDCVSNTNYRENSLLNSLPSFWYRYAIFALLSFGALKIMSLLQNRVVFRFIPMLLLILVFGGYAYAHWDGRFGLRIKEESKLQTYLRESIFPQEKDRGRILFFVKGLLAAEPRLQFLSGAYLCETVHVGELFFEGQYKESMKRENYLFYKEFRGVAHDGPAYEGFISGKMMSRDTLIDRTRFLCEKKEIKNLVTSEAELPFVKKDSVLYDESQWVFLYGCSER